MASKGGGGGGRDRQRSDVTTSPASGRESATAAAMLGRDKVWLADSSGAEGFILGRIVELAEEGPVVQPLAPDGAKGYACVGPPVQAAYDIVYPAEEDDGKEVEDNCGLMYLNEATLLRNIRLRYAKDKIYTYVANILVAVNPYFEVGGLYTADTIRSYMGRSLGTRPPHVYAIADKVRRFYLIVILIILPFLPIFIRPRCRMSQNVKNERTTVYKQFLLQFLRYCT
jgi:myosin-6